MDAYSSDINASPAKDAQSAKLENSKAAENKTPIKPKDDASLAMTNLLKTASSELLEGHHDSAASKFRQFYKKADASFFKIRPNDVELKNMVVLYAFASALVLPEKPKQTELDEAIKVLTKFETTKFPLFYYPLAFAYFKQTRFKLAIDCLAKAREFITSKQPMSQFYWPEHFEVIKESRRDEYSRVIHDLQQQCLHPPGPDFVCHGKRCKANGYERLEIYRAEPKFAGYVLVTCTKDCELEYHPVCWEKVIEEECPHGKERHILDKPCSCLGTCCSGEIILVRIFQANGQLKSKLGSVAATKNKAAFMVPSGTCFDGRKKLQASELHPNLLGRPLRKPERLARREAVYEQAVAKPAAVSKSTSNEEPPEKISGFRSRLNRSRSTERSRTVSVSGGAEVGDDDRSDDDDDDAVVSPSKDTRSKSPSRPELAEPVEKEERIEPQVLCELKKSSDDELEALTQQQKNKKKKNRKRVKSGKTQNVDSNLLNFAFKKNPEAYSSSTRFATDPWTSDEEEEEAQPEFFQNDELPSEMPLTETPAMSATKEEFLNDLADALHPDKVKRIEDAFIMEYFEKSPLFHDLFEFYDGIPAMILSDKRKRFEMISGRSGPCSAVTLKKRQTVEAPLCNFKEVNESTNKLAAIRATAGASALASTADAAFGSGVIPSSSTFGATSRPSSAGLGPTRSASFDGFGAAAAASSISPPATFPLPLSSQLSHTPCDRSFNSSSGNVSEQLHHRMSMSSGGRSADSASSPAFHASPSPIHRAITPFDANAMINQQLDRQVDAVLKTLLVDSADADEARAAVRKSIAPFVFEMVATIKETSTNAGNVCHQCDTLQQSLKLAATEKTALVDRLDEHVNGLVNAQLEKQQQLTLLRQQAEEIDVLKKSMLAQEAAKQQISNDYARAQQEYAQLSDRFLQLNAHVAELQNGRMNSDVSLTNVKIQLDNLQAGYTVQQRKLMETNCAMLKYHLANAMVPQKQTLVAAVACARSVVAWAKDIWEFLARIGAKPNEIQAFSVCRNAWLAFLNVDLADHSRILEEFFTQKLTEISHNHVTITIEELSRAVEQLPALPRQPDALPVRVLSDVSASQHYTRADVTSLESGFDLPPMMTKSAPSESLITHYTGEGGSAASRLQPISTPGSANFTSTSSTTVSSPVVSASAAAASLSQQQFQSRISRASPAASTPVAESGVSTSQKTSRPQHEPLAQIQNQSSFTSTANSVAACSAHFQELESGAVASSNSQPQSAGAAATAEPPKAQKIDKFITLVRAKLPADDAQHITREDILNGLRTVREKFGAQMSQSKNAGMIVDECAKLMLTVASNRRASGNGGRMGLDQFLPRASQVEDENLCPVCLEALTSKAVVELECLHVFHRECIRRWTQRDRTCPICRQLTISQEEFPTLYYSAAN